VIEETTMPTPLPNPAEVQRAIDLYVKLAYPGEAPFVVRSQMQTLKNWRGEFFKCIVFAPDPHTPPRRYALRLGNSLYPHMKLAIELAPNDSRFLYRADTHDRHICPARSSPDYAIFCQLMEKNQALAEAIEKAWEQAGLATFKAYLREDLKRRQADKGA
jgi:hypothetical protein